MQLNTENYRSLQQETLEIRYIQLMKEIDEAESKHKKP